MLYKRRNNQRYFFIIICLIILSVVVFFPNVLKKDYFLKQKTKVFIDTTKKEEIENVLKSKNLNYQYSERENSADILLTQRELKNLETIKSVEDFYVPVTGFSSKIENLSSDKLKKIYKKEINNWKELGGENSEIKIAVLDTLEVKFVIKEFLGAESDNFEKIPQTEDLLKKVSGDIGYISFLPLDKIDCRISTMAVDNISPIKSNDFSGYPYKINYFLQSNKKKSEERSRIIEVLKEYLKDFKKETVELIAVGDIMLSRHVGTKIRESKDNSLSFRKLSSLLSGADVTFANLESPFFDQGPPIKEGMVFKAEPETIEGLKLAGIDLVSLANNHFGNQGRTGMLYTFSHLKNNGINYFGAGNNIEEAHTATLLESKGTRFVFLSYNEISPESYKAGTDKAGLSWISENEEDLVKMENDIKKAKEKADFAVISFHWGTEYQVKPNSKQKTIAQRAINAGADIILAQHPHVVQGLSFINDKLVAYSLGNFIFDQMWSEETREGLVVKVYLKGNKAKDVDLIPIKIENFNQPRLASTKEAEKILARVYSASFGK